MAGLSHPLIGATKSWQMAIDRVERAEQALTKSFWITERKTSWNHQRNGNRRIALVEAFAKGLLMVEALARSSEARGITSLFNAFDARVCGSSHVRGGNIGRTNRSVFDPATGLARPLRSRRHCLGA
jgi:predicted metal-dependent enzyme (double-stranded beta helix superfamily)